MKTMYVYVMSNKTNTTLYIGVTSDLIKRVWQHKNHITKGFTSKYNVNKLVYFEVFQDELSAIKREKVLKNWHRKWKEELIQEKNPEWSDLYNTIIK